MIPEPKGLRCYATLGVSPHADSNALRQVPDFTRYTDVGVPGAVDFWRSYATVLEQQVEPLQQHVTSQQEVLDLVETEMDRLRAENQTQSHEIAKLGRENDCQKELVREKTVEVNALKEQICMMDVEDSKRRERSNKVREGKDQLRVLNKLRKEIKALKRSGTGSRQRSAYHRLKAENRRRELEGRELKNGTRTLEELKRESEKKTDEALEKATATSNTRNGSCLTRSNTKRSEAGKRLRSPEAAEESTTSETYEEQRMTMLRRSMVNVRREDRYGRYDRL
ncbi:hypothetical protein NEUTE1DRAFT_100276 [Neurospora tetrasperma FGSC 2508]|uniref:Uncharacterized protein n=1 Tax=Neurospora tetrasperma (strain FGSC 2508 / ATCC MYA-4615 / P0657) TaxID=510951 RepID=F8MK02_NEUT8|nr:uncharacterized protein NEUTE1DRAFT_100276 [Neurospora tetrasperma FGSC 2508]EGO57339.1 hypothetical protein NEUTE1DRAFT_100276 [Neurospora tetrasperma FGSC 2508]